MNKIFYRTVAAGVDVSVRETSYLETLFAKLGGTIADAYDKGYVMSFPTAAAMRQFTQEAKTRGAVIESI
jgi:hypothetical protein